MNLGQFLNILYEKSDCKILWPDLPASPISPVCGPVPEPAGRKLDAFVMVFIQDKGGRIFWETRKGIFALLLI